MIKPERFEVIRRSPKPLTISQIAQRLRVPYHSARRLVLKFRYKARDGRANGQDHRRIFHPGKADWRRSNVELARKFGVSRERVRKLRERFGIAKV